MKTRNRIIKIVGISLAGLVLTMVIAGFFASRYARQKLDEVLVDSGIAIGNVYVNPFTGSISLDDVAWTLQTDSIVAHPHSARIKSIRVGGLAIMEFIREKKIRVRHLSIYGGDVIYNQALKKPAGSTATDPQQKNPISEIEIGQLSLNDISLVAMRDELRESSATLKLTLDDIHLTDLQRLKDPQAYSFGAFIAEISRLRLDTQKSKYSVNIGKIAVSSISKEINVDSLVLLPKYSKYKFSRIDGKQVDRFVLKLPKLAIKGFVFEDLRDSMFTIASLELAKADLYVYRDKRLPFGRDGHLPLPMALIRTLPFGVAIDTLKISDTRIVYEEFPEKGYERGHIVFEKLNATFDHLSNRDVYSNYDNATLAVTSRVMGNGVIKARFTFPYSKEQIYTAKGSISNLSMPRLNPMLESLAFISVEEGRLNQLDFDFDYNDISSKGKVLINYENLKLKGLNKEKDPDKNELKTWILNVFLKKDKDEDVSMEKRIGKVDYQRDRRKAIFNVWVKSLFSGIKSSVVDTPAKKELNQTPKERRDSLRKVEKDSLRKIRKDRRDSRRDKIV